MALGFRWGISLRIPCRAKYWFVLWGSCLVTAFCNLLSHRSYDQWIMLSSDHAGQSETEASTSELLSIGSSPAPLLKAVASITKSRLCRPVIFPPTTLVTPPTAPEPEVNEDPQIEGKLALRRINGRLERAQRRGNNGHSLKHTQNQTCLSSCVAHYR